MNAHYEINEKGRDFVIGDLHGCYDLLDAKLTEIDFDEDFDRLFSVGDLVDRGPKNMECLRLIEKPWFHSVMGNHESMMIDAVINNNRRDLWEYNGGEWNGDVDQSELCDLAKKAKLLPYSITIEAVGGNVGISHAQPPTSDWRDVLEPSERDIMTMLWSREAIKMSGFEVGNIAYTVHGHTPVDKIIGVGNCLFIDTGAFYTGRLSMIQL